MAVRLCVGLVCAAAALVGLSASAQVRQPRLSDPARVDFNWQIRPLLSDRCFRCHGPDASKRKTKLRLDTREGAVKEHRRRLGVIKPGDPSSSELIRRINSDFEDDVMPPPESHLTLSGTRRRCSRHGSRKAPSYKPHWSLVPVAFGRGPELRGRPQSNRRVRARAARSRGPAARPRSVARGTDPPASPSTSPACRRRSPRSTRSSPIDRLAPTTRLVDRFLASPAYGERMAMDWLDLARYADTYGYQNDCRPRHVRLSRLGDRGVQPEPALRPVPDLAARRRPAAEPDARAADRHRLQPAAPADQRGRQRRGGVPHRVRRRPRATRSAPRCSG